MFKIESYITPIIINYIDKYVKDFRPQNAQVSLWGGEVSFQNLDIRLDVLQEELHLPLNIVSGHIHELTVRVPWTKIASEPIQINVNTIEFVVKLKSGDGETKKEKDDTKVSQISIAQEPPGYMATLINKIANNISIKLNNIIFKYIEDDIVLSMNIQMLSIDSADDSWNPAFIDINPVKVMLKKVININDLTICLDKRNAQGKIDVCQEPILYRCSLQARMIRKYNLTTAHLDSITRIDIFTENIDFKISVQQFPMLIRMYLLVQMLREFHTNLHSAKRNGQDVATGSGQTVDLIDGSYTTWIWNMLPEIFPASIEEERLDTQGHIFHNGFYAKNINITLKSQEMVSNTIIQTNTVYKYHPILKITLSGVSFDAISIGKKWTNVKGGISYIGVIPLGNCTCGKKHNLPTIFLSGQTNKGDNDKFLNDSLKDPNQNVNLNSLLYECDFQSHIQRNTETVLLASTPALSIDIVNYRQVLDDTRSYGSHSVSSHDIDSLTEEYIMRVFFGKFNLKIDTSLLHLYKTLNDQCQQYTYIAPYLAVTSTEVLSQLTPPSTEDYESLLDCIPLKKCYIHLNKSSIEYYHLNSDHFQSNDLNDFKHMPYYMININRAELQITTPMYPEKLINTTCQLPDPTEKLKQNCFNRYSAMIEQTSLDIIYNKNRFKVLAISNFNVGYDTLIQPELWKMIRMQSYTVHMMVSKIELLFNKPQFLLLAQLVGSSARDGICAGIPIKCIRTFQSVNMCQIDLPLIELCVVNFDASIKCIDHVMGIRSSVAAAVGFSYLPLDSVNAKEAYKSKTIFFSNEHLENNLFDFTVQYPMQLHKIKHPPIVNIELQHILFSVDSLVHQFLSFNLPNGNLTDISNISDEKAQKKVRKSSKVNKPLLRTESVHSNSITTMSVMTSATRTKDHADQHQIIEWYEFIKQTIVYINARTITVISPNKCLYMKDENSTLKSLLIDAETNASITYFRLPNLAIQATKFKNIQNVLRNDFPIDLTENWMLGINSFPWNIEMNDFCCYTVANNERKTFLPSVNTKLTLDLTKKDKEIGGSGEEMSFVIHLDTTPIRLGIDSTQQIKQIYDSLNTILLRNPKKKQLTPLIEVPATFYDTQINDFFCETTNSEKSSEDVVSHSDKNMAKIHCLLQWTITKFTLSISDVHHNDNIELLIDLEDIIVSIDKQSAYTKAKAKFGSINGVRKKKNQMTGETNVLNMISRSDALTIDSQETFLEIVATTAIASNVHSRWGTATKKLMGFRNDIDTITEIMITMQSIDLKLETDVLSVILNINNKIRSENSLNTHLDDIDSDNETVYSVRDLPLLFFDCKGLQLWLPNTDSVKPTDSNVLIVKINAISIAPSVENPIIRKPVREDIYVKAAQFRMINTPGSIIEDRQYELLLKNISVFTGNWEEILRFTCPANNENPAFDWNNQTEKPSLNINTIFNDSVLSIVYAPAIIFQSIVVCGQALEFNCINDLCLNLTLNDIDFLNYLRLKFANVFRESMVEVPESKAKKQTMMHINDKTRISHRPVIDQFDNHLSDSGFKSNCYQDKRKSNEKLGKRKMEIPHMLSFVGGAFTVQLYKNVDALSRKNAPLVAMQMMQPNFYCVQDATESIERFSMYNLTLKLFNQKIWEQTSAEFGDIIFDTHKGELDDTGIPHAFFDYQRTTSRNENKKDVKLQCNWRKPIQIKLTPISVEHLFDFKQDIQHIFQTDQRVNTQDSGRPIIHLNNIKEIRKLIGESNSIEFNLTKISINFMTSMDRVVSFALFKWNNKIGIRERIKQITYSTSIESMAINTQNSMLLNPTSMTLECILSQEKWSKRLVISTNFTSNIIHLQINPNDFWTFAKTHLDFWACLNNRLFNANDNASENSTKCQPDVAAYPMSLTDNLKPYELPQKTATNNRTNEEYFQDDLRLGTFEYIIANGENTNALPLPYQIYLLNSGAEMQICWRYPHPRTINFIQIYPVQVDISMKCQLEYFQESHNTFFPYVSFVIGNKKSNNVKLPKQKLTASVWRIVLTEPIDSTTYTEPDETNPLQDFLSPRTIISFIRIDSIFNVQNVPKLQANFKINKISLSVLNNCVNVQSCSPEILSRYTLKVEEHADVTQEFCQANFGNINVNVNLYGDMQAKVYNEFTFGVNIFDSSYLNVVPLIETISIGSYMEFSDESRPNVLHLTADRLSVRYGPAAGCAIATAKSVWQNTPIEVQMPILSRLVICNAMSVSLKFGQDQTSERIWLQTNECFYYAFRAEKLPQKLRFSVESENSIVEVPKLYSLCENDDVQMLSVSSNKLLLITARKLSTTQKQVIIKGQIELMNMTKSSFHIHYRDKNRMQNADAGTSSAEQSVILLPPMSNGSFFDGYDDSSDAYIRLQLVHENANGWSGEIPLAKSASTVPWLVKVPLKSEQKYSTFTVRIHSEYIGDIVPTKPRTKRILIVIWPFFTVRSLMPMDLSVQDKHFQKAYTTDGRGGCTDLQIAGTFDTEHEFSLDLGFGNQELNDLILTYKNIDKKTFFSIPIQFKSINDIIKELDKPNDLKWPCRYEKELNIERKASYGMSANPICKFSASRSLSCAMELSITPPCLFINGLGHEIFIVDATSERECCMQSNYIAPMSLMAGFYIKFKYQNELVTVPQIRMNDDKNISRQAPSFTLNDGDAIVTEKIVNSQIFKFCLNSINENNTQIISIQPHFVLCNFSKYQLKYHAFCIHRSEKLTHNNVIKFLTERSTPISIINNQPNVDNIFKGCGCTLFCDISQKTYKSTNYIKDLNYYVTISDERNCSAPILINKPITRTAFGIQLDETNVSLAASVTQHNNQLYISIYEDRFPFIEIDNQTNIVIYVAEADFADFSKSLKPKKSIHDVNFQWYCTIPAYGRMNFTPPSYNERFPEKHNANAHLIFACGHNDGAIQWSIPVETNKIDEKYLALPLYGDIKMTSFSANKTVKILLEHIDFKKEFNVKVVHTKLSTSNGHSDNALMPNRIETDEQYASNKRRARQTSQISSTSTAIIHNFIANMFIKEVNFILYDDCKESLYKKNNIASVFLDDFIFCYGEEERKLEFGFGNIQIDNNLYTSGKYDFPVILCSQNEANSKQSKGHDSNEKTSERSTKLPTSFLLLPSMREQLFENLIGHFKVLLEDTEFSAKEIVCSVQPLRVYIEDKFIAALLDFAIENLPSNVVYMPDASDRVKLNEGEILVPKIISEQVLSFFSEPLRLNRLCIKPLSILLSVHTCIRMYIALDHSPLQFAQFEHKDIYTTTMKLGYNIGMHYVSDAIFGAGWVVGSLEILGSPSGLARSVSTGLWDFVSMPVQGLMRGPWGVLLGITYGSASLIKNVTAGTVNSVTKLAASVARNLDRLTLDDEHLERTEAIRRIRPSSITNGLSQGLTGFGINLLGAVGGIARHALEAKSSVEVFTGLGKGILGVVTKPISGAAELLALTGQGVLHTISFNALPMAREIPALTDSHSPMSLTKVAWKILSIIDHNDSVLIVASAIMHDNTDQSSEVTVAITTKLLLLIRDSDNEWDTTLSISRTKSVIDPNDNKRLILANKSDDDGQQFHRQRILQYLSKTYVQSTEIRSKLEETNQMTYLKVLEFKDSMTTQYMAKYIQFLYYCLNTNPN